MVVTVLQKGYADLMTFVISICAHLRLFLRKDEFKNNYELSNRLGMKMGAIGIIETGHTYHQIDSYVSLSQIIRMIEANHTYHRGKSYA